MTTDLGNQSLQPLDVTQAKVKSRKRPSTFQARTLALMDTFTPHLPEVLEARNVHTQGPKALNVGGKHWLDQGVTHTNK